jgi:predicted DNA-binding transcriptional regulator AlpA
MTRQSTRGNEVTTKEILRHRDLKAAGYPHGATLYRLIKRGEFPRGKKISPNAREWLKEELAAWRAALKAS